MRSKTRSSSKKIKDYKALSYPITIEQDSDTDNQIYFKAEITDLPGCSVHGETVDEVIRKIQDAKISWIKTSISKGLEIPLPETEDLFSGKILLRIPVKLHMQLAKSAKKENISLNQHIRNSLEKQTDLQMIEREVQSMANTISSLITELRGLKAAVQTIHSSVCDTLVFQGGQMMSRKFAIASAASPSRDYTWTDSGSTTGENLTY